MAIVVTEAGFAPDDWTEGAILAFDTLQGGHDLPEAPLAVAVAADRDPADLAPWLERLQMIRVDFPSMADGRGFSIARRLRAMGFTGRLRAAGPLIADQMTAARSVGFDEIELTPSVAARQPEALWAGSRPSYRAKLLAD